MPAFFCIASARGVGGVGLEEAELVGIGTKPVVDAEAFAMSPIFWFDGDEIEVGAPMVTRCAWHRGVAHDGADFDGVVALCVLPFAIPNLELAVEVASGGYDDEIDAIAEC